MIQLIAHLFGDFVFQNDWMAKHKNLYTIEGWGACIVHCLFYSLPFLFVTLNPISILLIISSHFVIDKFSLAKHWNDIFKVGARLPDIFWIKTYLIFMVDMAFHLACNFLIIKYI